MMSLRLSNTYSSNCLAVEKQRFNGNSMGVLRMLRGFLDKTRKF